MKAWCGVLLVAQLSSAMAAESLDSTPRPAADALIVERLPLDTGPGAGQPSLARHPQGGFILSWQQRRGVEASLHYALLDEEGSALRQGQITSGRDWFVNSADFPSLVVLDNGDWLSFYLQKSGPGTYAYDIRVLRSVDDGLHWGEPVTIHRDGTQTEHGFVSMLAAGADRARLAWLDGRRMATGAKGDAAGEMHDGGHAAHQHGDEGDAAEHMTLRAALLDRRGEPFEEVELDELTCACCQTDAVRLGERGALLVYRDRTPAEVRDIQWLAHDGERWSTPRLLAVDGWVTPGCPVNGPAVAAKGEQIAVLWPTLASGEMELKLRIGPGPGGLAAQAASAPVLLAQGAAELGHVDLAGWPQMQGWLASSLRREPDGTRITLRLLHADGSLRQALWLGQGVAGFPRLAVSGNTALLTWSESDGAGGSRIGLARVRAPQPQR